MFKEKFNTCDFKHNIPTKFKLKDVKIKPKNEYVITFSLNEGNSTPTEIVFKTIVTENKGENYYSANGFSLKENSLSYDLIGEKN